MDRHILYIALLIGVLSSMFQHTVFGDVSANEQDAVVSMTIMKFHVNDQNLELGWKIINNSDHDVWLCETMNTNAQLPKYETFMSEDNETLVMRRRFDLPLAVWLERPIGGRYVRLHPGQDRIESMSLTVPLIRDRLFEAKLGNARYAKRLVLEIGFYDENLPGLLLHIADVAEKLSCDESLLTLNDVEIYARYYEGLWISGVFNDDNYVSGQLRESIIKGSGEIVIPHMGQARVGEQVLRATVEGVNIPYRGFPTKDEPPQSETEPNGVIMALTRLDVNDTKLELCYRIKNNTNHDVWFCDSIAAEYPDIYLSYEVYLVEDAKTLVIRKRLDVPWPPGIVEIPFPYLGRYLRLQPGQEKIDSISLDVPVFAVEILYGLPVAYVEHAIANRLVLEIGYYNEDLPELIRNILEVAEKLDCTSFDIREGFSSDLFRRYFKGLLISRWFGPLSHFNEKHKDVSKEFLTILTLEILGEEVLQIAVEDVSIPCEGFIADTSWKSGTGHNQSRQSSSADADKPGNEKDKTGVVLR